MKEEPRKYTECFLCTKKFRKAQAQMYCADCKEAFELGNSQYVKLNLLRADCKALQCQYVLLQQRVKDLEKTVLMKSEHEGEQREAEYNSIHAGGKAVQTFEEECLDLSEEIDNR